MRRLRIGKKRQVIIARDLAKKLGWQPGDELIAVTVDRKVDIGPPTARQATDNAHRLTLGQRLQFTFPAELARDLRVVECSEMRLRSKDRRLLLHPIDQKIELTPPQARALTTAFKRLKREAEVVSRTPIVGLDALSAVWKAQRKRRPR